MIDGWLVKVEEIGFVDFYLLAPLVTVGYAVLRRLRCLLVCSNLDRYFLRILCLVILDITP